MGSKKKKQNQNNNKSILVQWGFPVAVLVVIIVFLISNFTINSKESAEETIKKQTTTEIEGYAAALKNKFESISGLAQGAAAIIGSDGMGDKDKIKAYADKLSSITSEVYMVAITDSNGMGYASGMGEVDLSSANYYNNGSNIIHYYTDDNGLSDNEAFVISVPVKSGGEKQGEIYMFIDPKTLIGILPNNNFGGSLGYALITANGDIVYTTGSASAFSGGDNLFTNLQGATLTGLTVPQIKLRAEKQNKMMFSATKGTESKSIVIAPLSVEGWQLMTIISQKYVDNIVSNEMRNARKMIINLAIAIGVFLLFLVANAIINKIKYGEQSKDLADKADTDLLTELNNKIATERKIQEWMTENPEVQSLMFLFDIDNFKKINDTMGHAFGDEVLRTLGHQLRNEFRVTDIIGRLGGDEFVLFLKGIKSDDQLHREGERITKFFHDFRAGDYVKYSATASIGGVVVPRDATSFQDAYKAADAALYEAKRRGKNQLVFYSKDLAGMESIRVSDDVEPIADYRESLKNK